MAGFKVEDIKKSSFYTTLALGGSSDLLTVNGFIEEVKFPIDVFMIDRFWDNMQMDVPIYLDENLIKWCGYKGEKKIQKTNFLKFIKRNNIELIELKTPEYIEYYKKREYPSGSPLLGYKNPKDINKNSTNEIHILMSALNFKRMVMRLNTERGDQIRDYFLTLELLVKYYCEYQTAFEKRLNEFAKKLIKEKENTITVLNNKLDKIIRQNDVLLNRNDELKEDVAVNQEILIEINTKFDIATDDRSPKTKSITKRDKFMIVKLNDPKSQWDYYAIRTQHASLKRTLKKLKIKYSKSKELITIPYQPNGINFFNLMKEKLGNVKIEVYRNQIKLNVDYDEDQFLKDIKDLDRSKKEVNIIEENVFQSD